MSKFKKYLMQDDIERSVRDVILAENVDIKSFIKNVNHYSNLDDALLHLDDEYIEFYLLNLDDKKLKKELQKMHISEEVLPNRELNLGFNRDGAKIKKIKYKGEYITLEYNTSTNSWFPAIQFRSVATALRYIKKQFELNQVD